MATYTPPPTPEVQYLPALLRQIDAGQLRVPAFQRNFVWTEKQVIELLESVFLGFPIGSLLFWRNDTKQMRVSSPVALPFPDIPLQYPTTFVLDGMQRLTSLYGVLKFRRDFPPEFDVVFDLRERRFLIRKDMELPVHYLPLNSLLDPLLLINCQRALSEQADGNQLISQSVELQAVFQEYLIPTVTIGVRPVDDVVRIFERINSTGTKLSSVDFVRALTWKDDFDLRAHVESLKLSIEALNFLVPDESLVKALGVTLELPPAGDGLLALRNFSTSELEGAMSQLTVALEQTAFFFREEFGYGSYDFIPYEGQFLCTLAFFLVGGTAIDQLKKWNWRVAFTEGLRGRPDHVVSRLIADIRGLAHSESGWPDSKPLISSEPFLARRFTRGTALSGAIAGMFGQFAPLSITTGEPVARSSFLNSFIPERFGFIVPTSELGAKYSKTNKLLANICVLSELDALIMRDARGRSGLEILVERNRDNAVEILASQLVPEDAIEELRFGNFVEFLELRAAHLAQLAMQFSQ